MEKKSFWDLLVLLSAVNKEMGLDGPDRDAASFVHGLAFLERHDNQRQLALDVLFCCASMRSQEALASFCLKKGAQINAAPLGALAAGLSGALAATAESGAPYANATRTLAWLLRSGAEIDGWAGEPLAGACAHNQPESIEFLLKNGANSHAGGAVAWFSAAWSGLETRNRSISHQLLVQHAPQSPAAPAAEACARLAMASRQWDEPAASDALRELSKARGKIEAQGQDSAILRWASPESALPKAMRCALFSAHSANTASNDKALLRFLSLLSREGLALDVAQKWAITDLSMAAHANWRKKNPLSRAFLDGSLVKNAELADAAMRRRGLSDASTSEAESLWRQKALAQQEQRAFEGIALGPEAVRGAGERPIAERKALRV